MILPTSSNRRHARIVLTLRILAGFGAARLLFSFCEFMPWIPKVDFNTRYNEALCLRTGHDPYDVFSGAVLIPCVIPMSEDHEVAAMERLPSFPDFGKEGQKTMVVHAYPPWEYAWMLPWTYVPRDVAWLFHLAAEIVSAGAVQFHG